MPVRWLKKSYQNVTGLAYSALLQRLVQFDSILERDFIWLLDTHPSVEWFAEQPLKIRFRDECGIEQIYIPDFLIKFGRDGFLGKSTRQPWIVETKYRCDLRANWAKIRPKLRAGFREAHSRNSFFHIVSESVLTTVSVTNARFLRRYTNADVPFETLEKVVGKVERTGHTTVGSLLSCASEDIGQAVWTAIARRKIAAEFDRPFGPETRVWMR